MIRLIKALYERRLAEADNERVRLKSEAKLFREASNLVTERPDTGGWLKLNANDQEKGLDQSNHLEMIRKAREFYRFDPNARAALSTMVHYIMGRGLTITPKSDDPMVWYIWREFWTSPRNKMEIKQFELIRRPLRDGELFIEDFSDTRDESTGVLVSTGKTTIRFIDPLLVRSDDSARAKSQDQTLQNGVNTDPEDVEQVISYTVQSRADKSKFRTIPASRVQHIKLNVDSDQKRGETQLLPIMKLLKQYDQWLENRIILNKMRSAIVLIRKVEGTPGEVAQIAANPPTASNPSGTNTKQNFRGGSILTAGKGVSYEMLGPNLQASDAKEDGRNIKVSMAGGTNLPEYIFGDASNQNYASSLIAESPMVKAVQFWQIFFEFAVKQLYRKVIQNAVDGGLLDAPSDEEFIARLQSVRAIKEFTGGNPQDSLSKAQDAKAARAAQAPKELTPKEQALAELMPDGKLETPSEIFFGCDMSWPEIVHRDLKGHVEALQLARINGWIADPTACGALGYDYGEEVRKQRQVEEEAAKTGNPLLGTPVGGGSVADAAAMDAEMQDVLNQLSPDERDQVLNSKDPAEVARIMAKHATAVGAAAGNGNGGQG